MVLHPTVSSFRPRPRASDKRGRGESRASFFLGRECHAGMDRGRAGRRAVVRCLLSGVSCWRGVRALTIVASPSGLAIFLCLRSGSAAAGRAETSVQAALRVAVWRSAAPSAWPEMLGASLTRRCQCPSSVARQRENKKPAGWAGGKSCITRSVIQPEASCCQAFSCVRVVPNRSTDASVIAALRVSGKTKNPPEVRRARR